MKKIPQTVIQTLDFVFLGSGRERETPLRGVVLEDGRTLEGKSLEDLFMFAVVLSEHNPSGYLPCPIFNLGSPLPKKGRVHDSDTYDGLMPSKIDGDYLLLERAWESRVDVHPDGRTEIYAGQANYYPAIMLTPPLKFDASRRLLFVRSPNGKFVPPPLATAEWREGGKEKTAYQLAHVDLHEMKSRYTWAMNWGNVGPGFVADKNPHLKLKTFSN